MNRIDNVIYEIATDKSFVKVKGNALGIDKLILSFVEFDTRTKKSKNNIDIYLDVAEALAFAQEILNGKIPKLANIEKQRCIKAKEQYPKAVYFSPLGGVSEENARKRGLRNDGKAISRQFNFAPGAKADFLFTAIQKPGHTDPKTKLINPESNCRPEIIIRVACDARELKKFALMLQVHIQSFYTAKYATGGYDSDYQGNSTSTSVNNGNNRNRQGTSSQTLQQNNTQTQGYYSNASDYYNNHPNNNNYYTNNQYSG